MGVATISMKMLSHHTKCKVDVNQISINICKYVVFAPVDETAHKVYLKMSLESSEFTPVPQLLISCSYWTSIFFSKFMVKSHQMIYLARALGQVENQEPAKLYGCLTIWF